LSFALHNKETKLLPSDTFLSRKNAQKCVCGDPAGGAYSAPQDSLAGNGGGAPEKEEGKGEKGEGRGEERREGGKRKGGR